MTGSIPPATPLAYEGQVVVPFITRTFDPQSSFNTFPVPTIWINTASSLAYIQVSKALGVAEWILIGGAPGALLTITTPDHVVVMPSAGNINFLESGSMTITGSGNNILFNSTGGGTTWVEVTSTPYSLLTNVGYVINFGTLVTLKLPATAVFGSIIEIVGKGLGGWMIEQNAGQQIIFGTMATTSGTGGSLSSGYYTDCVRLVCTTANDVFTVDNSIGNLVIV
jgi:hypothetical protein